MFLAAERDKDEELQRLTDSDDDSDSSSGSDDGRRRVFRLGSGQLSVLGVLAATAVLGVSGVAWRSLSPPGPSTSRQVGVSGEKTLRVQRKVLASETAQPHPETLEEESRKVNCPPVMPDTGGVPRMRTFFTDVQAFDCLDTDRDGLLRQSELGPGATVADVGFPALQERIRREKYSIREDGDGTPPQAVMLENWVNMLSQETQGVPKLVKGEVDAWAGEAQPLPAALEPGHQGQVHSLFTFGAPGVSSEVVQNAARADGCFPGLRVYTRASRRLADYGFGLQVDDPIAWLTLKYGYKHPRSAVLTLDTDTPLKTGFSECDAHFQGPPPDNLYWFQGHTHVAYNMNIKALAALLQADVPHDVSSRQHVEVDVGNVPAECFAHSACASNHSATEMCCPSPAGKFLDCCSPPEAFQGRFPVDSNFKLGDYVRLTTDVNKTKEAFKLVVENWNPKMEAMLGQVFPIVQINSPGRVGLPSMDGSNGGIWQFPISVLNPVPLQLAEQYSAGPAAGLSTEGVAPTHGTTAKELIGKAVVNEELASVAKRKDAIDQHYLASSFGFALVGRAINPEEKQGLNAVASLFQDPASEECVVAFAVQAPEEKQGVAMSPAAKAAVAAEPDLVGDVENWNNILAGFEGLQHRGNKLLWTNGNSFGRRDRYDVTLNRPLQDTRAIANVSHIVHVLDFCGIPGVQEHVARSLQRFIRSQTYRHILAERMGRCSSVTAVGHDLGGALATLWSACANSKLQPGQAGYEDMLYTSWSSGRPGALRPFVQPSTQENLALMHRQTGLVLSVAGKPIDVELGKGALLLMEDRHEDMRRWELTSNGHLRSIYHGKCLGVNLPSVVMQWANQGQIQGEGTNPTLQECRYNMYNKEQIWNISSNGMLVNQYTGLCLSEELKVARCPISDEIWHMRSDGFLINQVSGMCLGIEGKNGIKNGGKAIIEPCEYTKETTDQKWELTEEGLLKNRVSSKCLDVNHLGGILRPNEVILWDCVKTLAYPSAQKWRLTPGGFLVNRVAGRCLDVLGRSQSKSGSPVVLGTCHESNNVGSYAFWELAGGSKLINHGKASSLTGRCVVALDSSDAIAMEHCDTNMRQRWEVSQDGQLHATVGNNLCVAANESKAQLLSCKDDYSQPPDDQIWRLTDAGLLFHRKSHKCLIADASRNDGSPVSVKAGDCQMTDQRWTWEEDGRLRNMYSGFCMAVKGSISEYMEAGSNVMLWSCQNTSTTSNQVWTLVTPETAAQITLAEGVPQAIGQQSVAGSQVHNTASGHCLEASSGDDSAGDLGSALFVGVCDDSNPSQRWERTDKGFLKHVASGLCADVPGEASHTEGELLALFACEEAMIDESMQSWALISGTDEAIGLAKYYLVPRPGEVASFDLTQDPVEVMKSKFEQNSEEVIAARVMGQAAGQFMTSAGQTWWTYHGYRHRVLPTAARCVDMPVAVSSMALQAIPISTETFECEPDLDSEGLAAVRRKYAESGPAALNSPEAAAAFLSNAGSFVTDGRTEYWQFEQTLHKIPSPGCSACGCQQQMTTLVQAHHRQRAKVAPFKCLVQS